MRSLFKYAQSRGLHQKHYFCNPDGCGSKVVYDLILAHTAALGFQPSHLAVVAPRIRKGYGSFLRKDRLLRAAGFGTVEAITLDSVVHESGDSIEHSACHSHASTDKRFLSLSWIPDLGIEDGGQAGTVYRKLVDACGTRYAFGYQATWHPRDAGLSMFYDPTAAYERLHPVATRWLHDVFPDNYLSPEYLDAPVGYTGLTLREWIERDPDSRGVLRPYTESLVEWRPPVACIPQIREELYRMGRVFYRPFLEEHNFERGPGWVKPIPNPLYRPDPFAAWETPKVEIPERFRAASYPETDDPQRVILHWYDAIRPRELGLR